MDLDNAVERIMSRLKELGNEASFSYDEVSEWLNLSPGDDLIWAYDKLSDRLTTEHSIRLELEKDCLIVAESDVIFGLASMYAAIASNIREESKAYKSLDEGINALDIGDFRSVIEEELSTEAYKKRFECSKRDRQIM